MVQTQRESTGASTADAAAAIQSQLGLTASPLANFTQDSSAGGQLAATLARLIVAGLIALVIVGLLLAATLGRHS